MKSQSNRLIVRWVLPKSFGLLAISLLSLLLLVTPVFSSVLTPEPVSTPATFGSPSVYPDLAIDNQGNLHAIWLENTTTSPTLFIYYSTKPAGGAWSPAELISTYDAAAVGGSIVAGSDGTIHVVWGSITGDFAPVYYINKIPGGSWSTPVNLRAGLGRNETTGAEVAVDHEGTIHVIWRDTSPGRYNVFYTAKPSGGNWTTPENLTHSEDGAQPGNIIIGPDNTVYVFYGDRPSPSQEPNNNDIFVVTKTPGNSWSAPMNISRSPSSTGGAITLGQDGNFHAILTEDGTFYYIRKLSNGEWSTPETILSNGPAINTDPSIAVNSAGVVHLLFQRWNDPTEQFQHYELYNTNRSTEGTWSTPEQLTNLTAQNGSLVHPGFGGGRTPLLIENDVLHFVWQQGFHHGFWSWEIMYGARTTNQPPTVNAGGPYSVNEGGSVTVTATGNDPEGGPLPYAWDLDNDGIFETPGQSVTFSAVGLDGSSSHTITVQATDDGSLSATDQAIVEVQNVAPSVNAPGVSLEPSDEGSSVTASATFSDLGVNDAPFTCTVNYGDGSGDLAGTINNNTCTGPSHTYTDNGNYPVSVSVADNDNGIGTSDPPSSHVVNNVSPNVDAGPDTTISAGQTFSGSGSFTDPGGDNWTANVDYGDGTGSQPLTLTGNTFNLNHVYSSGGNYTVTVVVDDDGAQGSDTLTVTVTAFMPQDAIESLIDDVGQLVGDGVLTQQQGNSLQKPLNKAIQELNKGKTDKAISELEEFIAQVNTLINQGVLTPEQGQPLIEAANEVIASLGG